MVKSPQEEGGRKLTVGCPMEVASYPASGLAYIDVNTPTKVSVQAKFFCMGRGCKWLLSNQWQGANHRRVKGQGTGPTTFPSFP